MKYLICLLMVGCQCKADFNQEQQTVINDIIWAADTNNVPRSILLAICHHEGRFRNDFKLSHMDGKSFTHGTCQVKLKTAQYLDSIYHHNFNATEDGLKVSAVNAFYAAKYLKYQLVRYKGDWRKAADAFNKGSYVSKNSSYLKHINSSLFYVNNNIKVIL